MPAASATLEVLVRGKDELTGSLNSSGNAVQSFGQKVSALKVPVAIAAAAVVAFGKSAVDAASDLNESINAVNVTFGRAAARIHEFGETSARSVGLSRRAFNEMATPLGAILQNVGFDMDQTADLTVRLTERAADMASVFNTDVTDALAAVQSALRGEANPIERYGVSVNAAAVEARALADTHKTLAKDLTNTELATARLAIIFDQTARVAGDFKNTSEGLANQQRILNSEWEDFRAEIGNRLMPVAMALVGLLNTELMPAIKTIFGFLSENQGIMIAVGVGFGILLAALFPVPAAILAITAAGVFLINHWDEIVEKYPILQTALDSVGSAFDFVKRAVDLVALGLEGGQIGGKFNIVERAAFGLGKTLRDDVIPFIEDCARAVDLLSLGLEGGQIGGEFDSWERSAFNLGKTLRDIGGIIDSVNRYLKDHDVYVTAAGAAWDIFVGAIRAQMSIFNTAAGAVRGLIGAVRALIDAINSIPDIPDIGIGIGGFEIGTGGISIPGFQHGGRVSAGRPVLVGEVQPEIFVPDSSGTILPSVGAGGLVIQFFGPFTINGDPSQAGLVGMLGYSVQQELQSRGALV